ncbi:MAG: hypothetical protein JW943_08960 [Deltaproteobacteria bacterium]|nr:hypothetical protein [Deltaproteobacteria bacterium]
MTSKFLKRSWLIGLPIILLMGCATLPPPQKITDPVELSNRVSYYYLKPSPDQIPVMLDALSLPGFITWPESIASYAGFFAEIFQQNQSRARKWVRNVNPAGKSQALLLLYAIALSDVPGKARLLERLQTTSGVDLSSGPYPHLVNISIASLSPASAADLDLLWGAFMASGNDHHVKKIIEALKFIDAEGDRSTFMLGFAAYWSLSSNVAQHKKVRDICESELAASSGRKAQLLDEILNQDRHSN